MHRGMIAAWGEAITLRRLNSSGPATEVNNVRARVAGYEPEEVTGNIQQGDRRVIVLAEDIGSFPVPFRERSTDRVVDASGREMTIQAVDDQTRRIAGVLIAYEIRARG